MRTELIVEKPGLLTTIQDSGRYGYQQYGMSVAGPMDDYAFQIANLLVANSRKDSVLEITLLGPTIRFKGGCRIAITGADLGAKLNGQDILNWSSIKVNCGDKLSFTKQQVGCRAYIAVSGGLEIPKVMGSFSTYLRGKIGGYNGRALQKGDALKVGRNDDFTGIIRTPDSYIPHYEDKIQARVIVGPQKDSFFQEELIKFFNSEYEISVQSDRMGYRLEGPKLNHKEGADIISEGISLGAIQVPGDGRPIIMMADRQTTGGYTKIANVISVDIAKLGQLKPGNRISFSLIDIDQAQKLYREREERLRKLEEIISRIYLVHGSNC